MLSLLMAAVMNTALWLSYFVAISVTGFMNATFLYVLHGMAFVSLNGTLMKILNFLRWFIIIKGVNITWKRHSVHGKSFMHRNYTLVVIVLCWELWSFNNTMLYVWKIEVASTVLSALSQRITYVTALKIIRNIYWTTF